MKTLITARFDKNFTDLLETITKDYEFAGYGVTGSPSLRISPEKSSKLPTN